MKEGMKNSLQEFFNRSPEEIMPQVKGRNESSFLPKISKKPFKASTLAEIYSVKND
jgi:hypothetical protein